MYFKILDAVPSAELTKRFNRDYLYAKLGEGLSGAGVLAIELFVEGGVTSESILLNGAMLMVRLSDYEKELNQTIAMAPDASRANLRLDARVAMRQESFLPGEFRSQRRPMLANRNQDLAYQYFVNRAR